MNETKSAAAAVEGLLTRLVSIDTTSSRPNEPLIAILEERLAPLGAKLTRNVYKDDAGKTKINLIAILGPEGKPELALVGHTDCVPYDAAWKEALTLTDRDGKLFGRGACDTKAFIACAIVAAERVGKTVSKPLALIFTADEEVGCVGAKRLVEQKAIQPRFAIVGEPTSLAPVRANKGYCLAELEAVGKEGHSAYPATGASAVFRAARFIARFEELALGELREETDVHFEPPYTTVNVGLIFGGKAKNIIPGSCKFTVEWRPVPGQDLMKVPALLNRVRDELVKEEPGFELKIDVRRVDAGVSTPATSRVVRFIEEQGGFPPATVPFGTEAPQLTQLGAEAVVFGPGDIRVAHQTGEFVPKAELHRAEEILEAAIREFCG